MGVTRAQIYKTLTSTCVPILQRRHTGIWRTPKPNLNASLRTQSRSNTLPPNHPHASVLPFFRGSNTTSSSPSDAPSISSSSSLGTSRLLFSPFIFLVCSCPRSCLPK